MQLQSTIEYKYSLQTTNKSGMSVECVACYDITTDAIKTSNKMYVIEK